MGRQSLDDQCHLCARDIGSAQVFDALGPAVLADHPRILRWPQQRSRVADARRVVAFGSAGSAPECAIQLPRQRHVHGLAEGLRGHRLWRWHGQTLRRARILDVDRGFQRDGRAARDPGHGRHLLDAALHHRLEGLANPPPHTRLGSTAGPTTETCSSTKRSTTPTSAFSKTSISSPPGQAALRMLPPTGRPARCFSGPCSRSFR